VIVLGITNNDLAGACLVKDNDIVAAVSEERFSRIKDDKVWPKQSISYVLEQAGINIDHVDYIAYGWNAGFDAEKHLLEYFDRIVYEASNHPSGLPHIRKRIENEIANDRDKRLEFDQFIAIHHADDKVVNIDHHESHALGAFSCSPFDQALVVTCDGRGDFQSLTVSFYSESRAEILQRETTIDSLGYFYGRITKLLGYKPNRHEGKITGLAAFGDPKKLLPLMQEMIIFENGRIRAKCGDYFLPSYDGYSVALESLIRDEKPADVAAAAQQHMEDLLVATIKHHLVMRGPENVCLAGGVFGNVKLNQRIREIADVRGVYVLPCMSDGGLALAAAVGAAHKKSGFRFRNPTMYLGPDAGETQLILGSLAGAFPSLGYHLPEDLFGALVEALSAGRVIGLFRGRMEFGPRALCHRSIVYHAADATVNQWLNDRMHRTEFMPFAPVTNVELAKDCYVGWHEDDVASDFMTMTYDCYPEFQEKCPAVVHVDGTARPQIIRPQADPFMHGLLAAWYRQTTEAALINTSFNKHEEPIVNDAHDAFSCLEDGTVDVIVVNEKALVFRKKNHGNH